MKYEIFIDNKIKRKRYVVITDWNGKKPDKDEAIRFAASKIFKIPKYKLTASEVYMEGPDADEFYDTKHAGLKKYIAVYRW